MKKVAEVGNVVALIPIVVPVIEVRLDVRTVPIAIRNLQVAVGIAPEKNVPSAFRTTTL